MCDGGVIENECLLGGRTEFSHPTELTLNWVERTQRGHLNQENPEQVPKGLQDKPQSQELFGFYLEYQQKKKEQKKSSLDKELAKVRQGFLEEDEEQPPDMFH